MIIQTNGQIIRILLVWPEIKFGISFDHMTTHQDFTTRWLFYNNEEQRIAFEKKKAESKRGFEVGIGLAKHAS